MKTKVIFIISMVIFTSGDLFPQNVKFDTNKLYYIYDYALNFYITNDFWGLINENIPKKSDISESYIKISKTELSDSGIYKYVYRTFEVNQILGARQKLFKYINFSKLHTQLKIKLIDTKKNELVTEIKDENCRATIQFSDIFQKDNKYYVILYGVSNYEKGYYPKENITFEFEICPDNGFIVFRDYTLFLGNIDKQPFDNIKGAIYGSFDNYPCDPNDIKFRGIDDNVDYQLFDIDTIKYNIDTIKKISPKIIKQRFNYLDGIKRFGF